MKRLEWSSWKHFKILLPDNIDNINDKSPMAMETGALALGSCPLRITDCNSLEKLLSAFNAERLFSNSQFRIRAHVCFVSTTNSPFVSILTRVS